MHWLNSTTVLVVVPKYHKCVYININPIWNFQHNIECQRLQLFTKQYHSPREFVLVTICHVIIYKH